MSKRLENRRKFIRTSLAGPVALTLSARQFPYHASAAMPPSGQTAGMARGEKRLRFSAIGLNHDHIFGQVAAVLGGGGHFVSYYAEEADLAASFGKRFPAARFARSRQEILEDSSIQLVLSAAIPDERGPLGIEVMRHGKDFMSDKPGLTTLAQLAEVRRAQSETRRIYSIFYGERFENRATVRAGELVKAGAIGAVVQTIGLGPHRMHPEDRPPWFFDRQRFGGILCDIASHQFDQFLFFTGSDRAQIVASQVGNVHHRQYPEFEDFGDVMVSGNGGTGYIRVDWFSPDGLNTWGDGRLTILGTEGYIEIRKNIDIAGRPGESHLFLVDRKETRYIDCRSVTLPYGRQLVDDVVNRTETAMSQEHCFLATELALKAQQSARKLPARTQG